MKIAIAAGHTVSGPGYGAVSGTFKESEITRAVSRELIRILRAKGHTVVDCTVDKASSQNAYLKETVRKVNSSGAPIFVTLHCNASVSHKGHGCEVFTWKGRKLDKAVDICEGLSKRGFRNRGVKDGSNLYVVKKTKASAILVELFFLDNHVDQKLYREIGYIGVAKAIAESMNK